VTGKKIVLTWDDGPSVHTDRLLDILHGEDARAVFFLEGKTLADASAQHDEFRARVRRMADEGHEICNHTLSHQKLTGLDSSTIQREVQSAEDLFAAQTGRRTRCIRPPFGAHDDHVLRVLRGLDYKVVLWSLNTYDWKYASSERPEEFDPDEILDLVRAGTQIAAGPLIHIQHDGQATGASIEVVPQVIGYLRAQGWTFITLRECLGGPIDAPATDG
jgi:peptidoglycan-N-acetylglucosamine deacetylase